MRKRDEIAPPDRCMRPLNSSPVHAYVPRFRHILRHRTVLRQARKPQIFIDPLDLGAHEGGGCRGFSHAAPINPPSPQNAVRREMRSEEHTSELQSLMRISYAVFCLKKKKQHNTI